MYISVYAPYSDRTIYYRGYPSRLLTGCDAEIKDRITMPTHLRATDESQQLETRVWYW